MGRQTPLYDLHRELGARIVDFGGWDMPLQYGSQIGEHHAVRRGSGVFDVSHMCAVDLRGERARELLRKLLANDVDRLKRPGKALYSCMLNETGGVLDDLIVYFVNDYAYRVVVNAGTRDRDLAWIREHARALEVEVRERTDLAILAIQGPEARAKTARLMTETAGRDALALEPFFGRELDGWFVARTGYTGEDGFEVMLPAGDAARVWRALNAAGVASCGLGARDTLRLEGGMNLYGNDMNESTHPFESGLGWTVALQPPDRAFVGRAALEAVLAAQAAGKTVPRQLVGLILEDRGVLRSHQRVLVPARGSGHAAAAADANAASAADGEITSGTFSPTLERSIALARIPATDAARVQVDIRGKLLNARIVKPPFVRFGKAMIDLPEAPR